MLKKYTDLLLTPSLTSSNRFRLAVNLIDILISFSPLLMDPVGALHSHAFFIHIDSGSRGNSGLSVTAWIIRDSLGEIVVTAGLYIPSATNNQAEYIALVRALLNIKSKDHFGKLMDATSFCTIMLKTGKEDIC